MYYDAAYAPFGESFSETGTADRSFTGQNQDTIPGTAGLYDFMFREFSAVQGRWVSPDPAGMVAGDPSNPQSWNRYGYVNQFPLDLTDSLGLVDRTFTICDQLYVGDTEGLIYNQIPLVFYCTTFRMDPQPWLDTGVGGGDGTPPVDNKEG